MTPSRIKNLALAWMFEGLPAEILPRLQLYPAHLEREIAALSIKIQSGYYEPVVF